MKEKDFFQPALERKEKEQKERESGIMLHVVENSSEVGKVVAEAMIEEINNCIRNGDECRILISGGESQRIINDAFLELLEGREIDMSNVTFVPSEVLWPDNPENSIVAGDAKNLENSLNEKGFNPKFVYLGLEKSVSDAKKRLLELSRECNFQVVTLHETGASKGVRGSVFSETDNKEKPRNIQGLMATREIVEIDISKIAEEENDQSIGKAYSALISKLKEDRVNDPSVNIPEFYITEGYKSYVSAKNCYVVASGERKQEAVKMAVGNVITRSMTDSEKKEAREKRREGVMSGKTVLDLREKLSDKKTHIVVDKAAAELINSDTLESRGIKVYGK